jgi:uncharacterized protein YndB with AHSA1/START domain
MEESPSTSGALRVRRFIRATPDEVFRAWTEPGLIEGWMSPAGSARAEVDLRVGGRFRVVMAGAGMEIEHTGEYLEVQPPKRLSFTWRSPYTGNDPSVVRVVLSPLEDGTELVLTHERLPEGAAPSHRDGWGRMLERLIELLKESS